MIIESFTDEYRFLSNFYPAIVEFEGIEYPTVENAYVAAKTTSIDIRNEFDFSSIPPGKAKALGRKITLREDWDEVKVSIMELLLRQKFTKHKDLTKMLLDTGDCHLVEGNLWGDTFWGVDLKTEKGNNVLGILLMNIRKEICNGTHL